MKIRAVIWDLGGVLVRTEDSTGRDLLSRQYGISRLDLENIVFDGTTGILAQLGQISDAEHWEAVRQEFGLSQTELHTFQANFWSGDRLDNNLVAYIRDLKSQYKIGLLSNNFADLRTELAGKWQIEDLFDTVVISAEVGMLKPDPRIYRLILDWLKAIPEQVIFIDDSMNNLIGAEAIGIQIIHFKNSNQVITALKRELEV